MTSIQNREYAIHRIGDGMWLADDNADGTDPEWVREPDNATWWTSEQLALSFASLCGAATNTEQPVLADGLEVASMMFDDPMDAQPDEIDVILDRTHPLEA